MVLKSLDIEQTILFQCLNISSLSIPQTDLPESDEDLEGYVLEKLFLYDKSLQFLKNLFAHFAKLRISNDWQGKEISTIRKWIQSS